LSEAEHSDANKVRGCASQVWLVTEPGEGRIDFRGDSDAHIVRGLIALLLRLYGGRSPEAILAFDARAAFERLGLGAALSAQRSNGLAAMVERIRRDAGGPWRTRSLTNLEIGRRRSLLGRCVSARLSGVKVRGAYVQSEGTPA
jgi:cysteine desulfuration protein SufE